MGLFGKKKTCSICEGKVGLLGYKLANEEYLCSNCRSLCTPGTNLDFKQMTSADVQANMDIAAANRKKGTDEFKSTVQLYTGAALDKPIMFIDETHGWFMDASRNDGWVYNLKDIANYHMRISTSKNDDKKDQGFFEWLFSPDFNAAYPELPSCPYGEKIIGAYLTIQLVENELGVDTVEFDVFPGLFTNENDIRASYECCHKFYEFMKQYRSNAVNQQAAAPAASESDNLEALEKLHSLMESGIITQEEFDAKKKQLLGL